MRNTILICSGALAIGVASVATARSTTQRPGSQIVRGAYLTQQPPAGLEPARNLSADARRENFDALWQIIDTAYAGFTLKSIDWTAIGRRYRARLDTVTDDDQFYLMMFQLVNELKDTHSWLQNYKPPPLAGVADLPIDLFQSRPFVVAGPKSGWEVISIDGLSPAAKIESLRPVLHASSSERAFQREAARALLRGSPDQAVAVTLRSPEGRTENSTFPRGRDARLPAPPVRVELTRQRFVHFGRHSSGIGCIRIESFSGRAEIAAEFDRALETLRDTPGLVVDIRDNTGGYGHAEIVGRFLSQRTLTGYSHVKNGPRHNDLDRREMYIAPSGSWQYTRPVALLVNDVTGSAADLFASELRSRGRVITVGTTTHGNLSGTAIYGVLPCGLIVRISNGYISDAKDRPIEVNGNVPDVIIEPTIQDYLAGNDPVLDRAVELLLTKSA